MAIPSLSKFNNVLASILKSIYKYKNNNDILNINLSLIIYKLLFDK